MEVPKTPNPISGKTRLAGLIGWPVAYSLSPLIHNHWIATYGLDACYVPLPTPPEKSREAVLGLAALGFRGANVTAPHKRSVISACDELSDLARHLDSVNTLIIGEDGKIFGDSTDGQGFLTSISEDCPTPYKDLQKGNGGCITILGAGGAARAIAFACATNLKAEIVICNRTLDAASHLVESLKTAGYKAKVQPWDRRKHCVTDAQLLINSTSLGMSGKPRLELDLSLLQKNAIVADIVYSPMETELLREARQRGAHVSGGLGMLLHQARPGFEAWFGILPQVDIGLRTKISNDLKEHV